MKANITLAVVFLCAVFAFYVHRASPGNQDSGALFVALALGLVAIGWALLLASMVT